MAASHYAVETPDGDIIAPGVVNREEAIRLACETGGTAVRRSVGDWKTFNTGVVDPCLKFHPVGEPT